MHVAHRTYVESGSNLFKIMRQMAFGGIEGRGWREQDWESRSKPASGRHEGQPRLGVK